MAYCCFALTRRSTLDHLAENLLTGIGTTLTVFRRGTRAAAAQGSWRLARLKTLHVSQDWILWASRGPSR